MPADLSCLSTTLRLSNGAELRVQQQPWAEQAGICLRVAAGSHDEPAEYPGLAHFLEHLLFLGSRGFAPDQGLMAYVRRHGGQVNASTQACHTDYVCQLPAELLRPALQRLLDMLCHPLLTIDSQLREREVLQAEYKARSQDGDSRIDHALGQALAAGHRCGDFLAGNRSSLPVEQRAFQQALASFHQRHYQAAKMCLTLVGPQPRECLLALAESLLGPLPAQDMESRAVPTTLLPLRATRLELQHAQTRVCLGYALQLDESGLDQALALLLDTLHDSSTSGLQAGLCEAGLCRQLHIRVLYRRDGQCLLRFDLLGADAGQITALRGELQAWAGQLVGNPAWLARLFERRQALALQMLTLEPLAQARRLQEQAEAVADDQVLHALDSVLRQMAEGSGAIELICDEPARPIWPATGLALNLSAGSSAGQTGSTRRWQLLPREMPALVPVTMPQAALRWLAPTALGGPAALCWCAPYAAELSLLEAQAILSGRIADCCRAYERLGVVVQLNVQKGLWSLALQGASSVLVDCSTQLLLLLLAPLHESDTDTGAGFLLRQLLQRLPEFDDADGGPTALQGVGAGLESADQQRIEVLFDSIEPWPTPRPPAPRTAFTWHALAQPGDEAALLLFCPLPEPDARTEAAWRLLAHHLQERFYQRLRGELQLGYALFAGFRQVQRRRGVLFALQSPVCDAGAIFGHIRTFLQQQLEGLGAFDESAVLAEREALLQALAPARSHMRQAEVCGQAQLAGLPQDHPQQLRQALAELTGADLRVVAEQLLQSQAGWLVVASGEAAPL